MAILKIDDIVAGLQPPQYYFKVGTAHEAVGLVHSHAYSTGMPGAAVAPAPGLAGASLTTYAGQIPFTNPGAGNTYLAQIEANATVTGQFMLYDRIWHNSGITMTTTTGQTINSTAWPARDRNGAVTGDGILVGIEVSALTGNGGAITNTTLTYTNSANANTRTATMASFPQSAVAGTFVPFQLAAGDVGVQSIQTLTLGTSYVSGTIHLVAYRLLATLPITVANVPVNKDFAALGLPRLYDNTVPFVMWRTSSATAVTLHALMTVTQG